MYNPTAHPVTFTIDYFNATDFQKQVPLLSVKHVVDPKSSKALPPAKDVLKLTCGLTWDIQIDASTTTHIGHVIFQITTDKCQQCTWKELEPEIKYSEWGECKAVSTPTTAAACSHSRTKTTTIREQNTCTEEIRVKSSVEVTESEPCECKCVEEWIEQEPVVTYGEWSECRAIPTVSDAQCAQTRTKTTVINEKNSCTNEVREKSRKTENESQPCTCACVEEWKELTPDIIYGEWSECGTNKDFTCEAECSQSRSKRVIIREENVCTKSTRVKSDTTTTETRPCECPPPKIVGYCHVSNKGKDGNVNLVVSFKQAGLGHEAHATDPKYCPKDRVVYATAADYTHKPPPPPEFDCKLEGGPLTELYCACQPFLDEAKTCPSIVTGEE
jgi:hypothetical protein